MQAIAQEKTMTVKEVAEVLGVSNEAVKKHIRYLYPEIIKNGVATYLTEKQVVAIKQRMIPTTQVVGATTELEENQTIINALTILKRRNDTLQQELTEAKPKIDFYNQVTNSKDAIDIGSAAKVLNYGKGRNSLFEFLRNDGILMPNNQPYQTFIDRGYFRLIEQKYTKPDGSTHINIKTVVYQKGLDFIRRRLRAA